MMAMTQPFQKTPEKPHVSFGKQNQTHLQHYANLTERELFYYLINLDEFPSVGVKAKLLVDVYLEKAQMLLADYLAVPQRLQPFTYTPEVLAERLQDLYEAQLKRSVPINTQLTTCQLNHVLKQYAPLALVDGCWLQNISLAATNHTDIVTRLFGVYAEMIGDGDTTKHYGNIFRELLRSARIYLPEVSAHLFTVHKDLQDSAFIYPAFQLALSQLPRVYLPEIIGFTLGHYFDPQDRLLVILAPEIERHGFDGCYGQLYAHPPLSENVDAQALQELVVIYLESFSEEDERQQQWQRIWTGLAVHTVISEKWLEELQASIDQPKILSAHEKMLAMVQEKAPHARNMHRNRKMGGQLINDWFAQDPFDAEGFLQALADSPFINLNNPLESTLLTRSISFGGPMFRIFTDAEQGIITEWVQSLACAPQDTEKVTNKLGRPVISRPVLAPLHYDESQDLATYAKCNKRQLYYYLVNADYYPDVLPMARKTAQQYFDRAKAEMGKWGFPKHLQLFPYNHDVFESRIHQLYQDETSAYQNFVPPSTVPREIMVWYVQQYAPFPMVDGSWVQHIAKAGVSQTEISARLFRIYSDEVGNGNPLLNHPNVYRKLLEKEGIFMPPTDSLEFAMQPTLRDFAFDLPLLTLAVSLFPKAFLPEIIGVNLAIELSGLGKGYMQVIDELRFWKMDPYFFTLHLTIDNIASGHTAVAMETVHLYLDQVLANQGQLAMQREWERIWVGFLAFKQGMARFDSTLEREASLRFLMPLIRQTMTHRKEKKQRLATVR